MIKKQLSRRQFMAAVAAGGFMTATGLWMPGEKLISIPRDIYRGQRTIHFDSNFAGLGNGLPGHPFSSLEAAIECATRLGASISVASGMHIVDDMVILGCRELSIGGSGCIETEIIISGLRWGE